MDRLKEILVVGAGPSGLAAALFLSQQGHRPRVVEKNNSLSINSKALGVNPQTLLLLEQSGLTRQFLKRGRKMDKINLWHRNKLIFQNDFSKVRHKYPFMLIQPQKDSEQLLWEELCRRRVEVEFGVTIQSLTRTVDGLHTAILGANGKKEEQRFDLIIGADGARSKVRDSSGIQTTGFQYEEEWELYDVELNNMDKENEGHVRVFEEGGLVMIRLKENIWRVAGNMASLLNYLPKNTTMGKIEWQSKFKISHRIADELYKEGVVIIGDAAHLHSPVGGRGMNLGIEDAHIVSQLIKENRTHEYTALRHGYLRRTVGTINRMTQSLAGNTFLLRSVRANFSLFRPLFPLIMPTARKFILGLNK